MLAITGQTARTLWLKMFEENVLKISKIKFFLEKSIFFKLDLFLAPPATPGNPAVIPYLFLYSFILQKHL